MAAKKSHNKRADTNSERADPLPQGIRLKPALRLLLVKKQTNKETKNAKMQIGREQTPLLLVVKQTNKQNKILTNTNMERADSLLRVAAQGHPAKNLPPPPPPAGQRRQTTWETRG